QVLCLIGAVRQLGEGGAGAALRVVEDLRHPGAEHRGPVAARQLEQATLAGQVRRSLRAQVGQPLVWVAHLGGKARQSVVVGPRGRNHHPLLLQPGGAGRHAGWGRATHVGVMGAAGGKPEQRRSVRRPSGGVLVVLLGIVGGREDGRDQGDVRQGGALLPCAATSARGGAG